jgi:hypothetical protein
MQDGVGHPADDFISRGSLSGQIQDAGNAAHSYRLPLVPSKPSGNRISM